MSITSVSIRMLSPEVPEQREAIDAFLDNDWVVTSTYSPSNPPAVPVPDYNWMRVERSVGGGAAIYFVTLDSRRASRTGAEASDEYSFLEGSLTQFTLPEGVSIIQFAAGDFGHDGISDILLQLSNGAVMVLEGHEAGVDTQPTSTPGTNQAQPPRSSAPPPPPQRGSGATPPPPPPSSPSGPAENN